MCTPSFVVNNNNNTRKMKLMSVMKVARMEEEEEEWVNRGEQMISKSRFSVLKKFLFVILESADGKYGA